MQGGPDQFREWIGIRFGGSQKNAAAYLGWDETYVSQVVNGRRTPNLENVLYLEKRSGIPVEAWAASALDKSDADSPANTSK